MQKQINLTCVDCGFTGDSFNLEITGNSQGAFTYQAKCPVCSSHKVKYLAHPSEDHPDLYISVVTKNRLQLSAKERIH